MSGPAAGLYGLTVQRPVATLMIVIAIAVFGWLSYGQLRLTLMPELSYPTLTVRTTYEGAAPEEMEAEVTKPVEEVLRTVEGVVDLESTSRAGVSDVLLRFQWDMDMDYASQRVRERVDVLPLPEDAERPLLLRYDPTLDPILRIGLSGEMELAALRRYAEDEVARELEKLDGVAIVRVRGGREEVVRIDLDQQRMSQLGVSVAEVEQRLRSENVNIAGGQLEHGQVEYLVRTLNEFQSLEEIGAMAVVNRGGRSIPLSSIGRVFIDHREREVATRLDGRESVEIAIYKEADANLVEVSQAVKARLFGTDAQRAFVEAEQKDGPKQEAKAEPGAGRAPPERPKVDVRAQMTDFVAFALPPGVSVEVLSDQSVFIENAIDEVQQTALLGALLAILIIYIFLRSPYSTCIIALAIPLSVVFTFAPMRALDISLNIMSLGGLALGIGMLVDNSIVVLESIFRCREEGDDVYAAAIRGTQEVGGAVVASTLTTTAVFFPLVFVEGVAGQLFGDLALTVVFSLLASLVVALFVVPMLAARSLGELASPSGEGGETGLRARLKRWLRLSAWDGAARDVRETWAWCRAGSGVLGALRWLVVPIALVWGAFRFAIHLPLELVFSKIIAPWVGLALWLGKWVMVGVGHLVRIALFPLTWAFERGFEALTRLYPTLLRGALRARVVVLVSALGLFGGALWLLDAVGTELIPQLHQGEFKAEVTMPVGTRLEETEAVVADVEGDLRQLDGVERVSTIVGAEVASMSDADRGPQSATLNITLAPARDLEAAERAAMDDVRAALSRVPGAQVEIVPPTLFTLTTPVQVQLRGHNLSLLQSTAGRLSEVLTAMPELADVRSNVRSGYPEVQIRFRREVLAAWGLTVRQVADVVRDKVQGSQPSAFHRGERRIDMIVRNLRDQVATLDDLRNLVIGYRTSSGATPTSGLSALGGLAGVGSVDGAAPVSITLGAVADLEIREGPAEIRHLDGQRAAVVEASSRDVDLVTVTRRIEQRLESVPLPRGFSATVAGQNEELEVARRSMMLALLLAIFLVYVVMASQFESVLAPFVIIFTIPLATVGVALALYATDTPMSVVVFIGLIMLAGIVVNNAIVLVDYITQLQRRGRPRRDAIVEACTVRLRPVLITTLTTVLGLVPMAIGLGEGAEVRTPMAITVIAGLSSSTLLTLVVIPVVYDVVMGWRREQPEAAEAS